MNAEISCLSVVNNFNKKRQKTIIETQTRNSLLKFVACKFRRRKSWNLRSMLNGKRWKTVLDDNIFLIRHKPSTSFNELLHIDCGNFQHNLDSVRGKILSNCTPDWISINKLLTSFGRIGIVQFPWVPREKVYHQQAGSTFTFDDDFRDFRCVMRIFSSSIFNPQGFWLSFSKCSNELPIGNFCWHLHVLDLKNFWKP